MQAAKDVGAEGRYFSCDYRTYMRLRNYSITLTEDAQ
jgi:hypothetical protein